MAKPKLIYWTIYDDDTPFAVFVDGHVDCRQFTLDDIREAITDDYGDPEYAEYVLEVMPTEAKFEHLWLTQYYGDEGDDPHNQPNDESPWYWCDANGRQARPVTGMKF
jgi:hypothetical protein